MGLTRGEGPIRRSASASADKATDPQTSRLAIGLGANGEGWINLFAHAPGVPPSTENWPRVPWLQYQNSGQAFTYPALGDIDGDGRDELVVGLGPLGQGWVWVADDAQSGYASLGWFQTGWADYDQSGNAPTRPTCADLDGDGRAEILVGLGDNGQGWFPIFRHHGSGFHLLVWGQVNWPSYTESGPAPTYPAGGDLDADGNGEVAVGLGGRGQGWVQILNFDGELSHRQWLQTGWESYDRGSLAPTYPALGDLDGDGRADLVIGLGGAGGGWIRLLRSTGADFVPLPGSVEGWYRIPWPDYVNSGVAPTYPTVGDANGDGDADVAVGLGDAGEGWVFGLDGTAVAPLSSWGSGSGWLAVDWLDYSATNPAPTFPSLRPVAGLLGGAFVERASVNDAGVGGDGVSDRAVIAHDGRYVAFTSRAKNIDGTFGLLAVYLRDRVAKTTRRISRFEDGREASGSSVRMSPTGRKLVFHTRDPLVTTDVDTESDAYLLDLNTDTLERITASGSPVNVQDISPDGTRLLVATRQDIDPLDTNGKEDLYLLDLVDDSLVWVSPRADGQPYEDHVGHGLLSANCQFVLYLTDEAGVVEDTNGDSDYYRFEVANREVKLVSLNVDGNPFIDSHGVEVFGAISGDGNLVAFVVPGGVYLREVQQGVTTRLGSNGFSSNITDFSSDGRFLIFTSTDALRPDDTNGGDDVYVLDRLNETYLRMNLDENGGQENFGGAVPSISGDGRYVVFESGDPNLVSNDTNGQIDVFVSFVQRPQPGP